MPFCRKCGRRLPEYSKICPECKTSTTGPIINIKKAPAKNSATVASEKITKAVIVAKKAAISFRVVPLTKSAKRNGSAEAFTPTKSVIPTKPAVPDGAYPGHEILKSNASIEEDILINPKDYETQTFNFDLQCKYSHFWPAGKALPTSNGKAFCPKCGEQLEKTEQHKRRRYRRL